MKITNHLRNLKESVKEIEIAVKEGLENKQRTIGFNTSAACVDMLEIYLHRLKLLPEDHMIKHEWLNSKNKIEEKLPFDFEAKEELLLFIRTVESKRNNFCSGKQKTVEELSDLVKCYNKVRKKFEELGVDFENE